MKSAILLLVMAAGLAGQFRPNLSGTWVLDRSRGDSRMERYKLVIEHRDPEIQLISSWKSKPNDEGDFEEHERDVLARTIGGPEQGRGFSSRMYWQGEKLLEEWKMQLKEAAVHGTITRYLADAGRTLIVETVSSGSSTRQKMYFTRKIE